MPNLEMSSPSDQEVVEAAREILARPEFHHQDDAPFNFFHWLFQWLGKHASSLEGLPWKWILITLVCLLVGSILYRVWKSDFFTFPKKETPKVPEKKEAATLPLWDDMKGKLERALAEENTLLAMALLREMTLVMFAERKAVELQKWKTHRDYLNALESEDQTLAREIFISFEKMVFGHQQIPLEKIVELWNQVSVKHEGGQQ